MEQFEFCFQLKEEEKQIYNLFTKEERVLLFPGLRPANNKFNLLLDPISTIGICISNGGHLPETREYLSSAFFFRVQAHLHLFHDRENHLFNNIMILSKNSQRALLLFKSTEKVIDIIVQGNSPHLFWQEIKNGIEEVKKDFALKLAFQYMSSLYFETKGYGTFRTPNRNGK